MKLKKDLFNKINPILINLEERRGFLTIPNIMALLNSDNDLTVELIKYCKNDSFDPKLNKFYSFNGKTKEYLTNKLITSLTTKN